MVVRENWIDSIKGMAIAGMVSAHFILFYFEYGTIPSFLCFLIYSFHMPLLFFVSGYLSKPLKGGRDTKKIIYRIIDLLVPALILGTFCFFVYLLRNQKEYDGLELLIQSIVNSMDSDWFLLVLCFVTIFTTIICDYFCVNLKYSLIVCVIVTFVAYPINSFFSQLAMYFVMYILGRMYRRKLISFTCKKAIICGSLWFVLCLLLYFFTKSSVVENPIYKMILSICAIVLLVYIFQNNRIQNNTFLCLLGRYSLETYIFHMFTFLLLDELFKTSFFNVLYENNLHFKSIFYVLCVSMIILTLFFSVWGNKRIENSIVIRLIKKPSSFLKTN